MPSEPKSAAELLTKDNDLALSGAKLSDPRRQSTLLSLANAIPVLALTILLAAGITNRITPEEKAPEAPQAPLVTKNPTGFQGQALIIGQNHFDVSATVEALPHLKESGAEVFAMELPEDYQEPILDYLQSQRTTKDREELSQKTHWATQLNLLVVEDTRQKKEQMLKELTGQEHSVTSQEIISGFQEQLPKDTWVGAAKLALGMLEKAHDAGLKVVCIDRHSVEDMLASEHQEENFEARNAIMAGHLAKLTQGHNVVAAVGAAHTGVGNGKSVEAMARKLGVECLSVDTDSKILKDWNPKPYGAEGFSKSDEIAINPTGVTRAFQKLRNPEPQGPDMGM
jgi:hypothetical protein